MTLSDQELNVKIAGKKFGRLIGLHATGRITKGGASYCLWLCECGNLAEIIMDSVISNHTKSCGCLRSEITTKTKTKHGHANRGKHSGEYRAWRAMLTRCMNSKNHQFKFYGGRGITVCEKWKTSFNDFLNDVGWRPSSNYSIERINNNGNYEPGNCKWATRQEQCVNRRSNIHLTLNGRTQTASQWADELGIKRDKVYDRLRRGYSAERALCK